MPDGPADGERGRGNATGLRRWIPLALAAGLAALVGFLPRSGSTTTSGSIRLLIEGTGKVRSEYWLRWRWRTYMGVAFPQAQRADGLDQLHQFAQLKRTPDAQRILAVARYASGRDDWREALIRLRDTLPKRTLCDVDEELATWNAALGDATLAAGECQRSARFLRSLEIGWYRHVALAALFDRCGQTAEAERHRRIALRPTDRLGGLVVGSMLVALVGSALLLVTTVVLIVRQRSGRPVSMLAPLPEVAVRVLTYASAAYFGGLALLRLVVPYVANPILQASPTDQWAISLRAVVNAGTALLSLLAPCLLLVVRGRGIGLTGTDLGLGHPRLLRHFLMGLGGYAVGLPLVVLAVALSARVFEPTTSRVNPAALDFALASGPMPRGLLIVLGCIIAPFAEEFVFRGILLRALQPVHGLAGAAVLSSLLFALLHPQLPMGFLSIFLLGMIFSALYGLSGSLWPSIFAHAINNSMVFAYIALYLGS